MKKRTSLLLLTFFLTTLFSCTKDGDLGIKPIDTSITGKAIRTNSLSVFVEALKLVDLANTLKGPGPYTVFAPTNDAFATFLTANNYASLDAIPAPLLKQILLNHVITGSFQSTALATGYIKSSAFGANSTTNALSLYIDTTTGVKLNGIATVTSANNNCSNGVLHIVDAVLGLPTVVTHINANPDLSTLAADMVSTGQPDFATILGAVGPFTIFAPTNEAFVALDTELAPTGLVGLTADNLTRIIQYHATTGSILAANLSEGEVITTLQTPQSFSIQLTGGPKIKDINNRVANITTTDIQCDNGVVHLIDKVLLPVF